MASSNLTSIKSRYIMITGLPGVGKTILIKKIYENLVKEGFQCNGFFTEEVRSNGHRIGFDVITTDKNRGQLARLSDNSIDVPVSRQTNFKVGQYTVNISSFEFTALPSLYYPAKTKEERKLIYLVDEIGKMELFSQSFIQAIKKLMSQTNVYLIATIPVPKGRPLALVEELRNNPLSHVVQVTHQNRNSILSEVMTLVHSVVASQVT
uniref:AAA+ ATPase domain-containing protein n=1 Tax=Biomphalaria glabrata TaxID=6526 RepID=A0A2C9LU97_BIOGL